MAQPIGERTTTMARLLFLFTFLLAGGAVTHALRGKLLFIGRSIYISSFAIVISNFSFFFTSETQALILDILSISPASHF